MEGKRPNPGDIMVCFYCGAIMLYRDDLALRDPTPAEMGDLQRGATWPEIKNFQEKFRNAVIAAAIKL